MILLKMEALLAVPSVSGIATTKVFADGEYEALQNTKKTKYIFGMAKQSVEKELFCTII